MAINFNTVADRVFDQLKGFGYSIVIFDANNKQTMNADQGRTFYSKDDKFEVIIDEKNNIIKVKYGENTDQRKLSQFIESIKNGIAKKYVIGVDRMPYTGKDIELKDTENEHLVKESLGPTIGSMKTSYQQTEGAKLIIRHNKPVNEEVRGSRSRNIQSLFIENAQGERFKYPHNHLLAARTMTQHVAKGGTLYDQVGQKIIGLSEERTQLLKVAGYIKGQGLQEQAGDVQFAVTQRLGEIKNLLGKYNPDRFMRDIHEEDETNLEALKERLTKNVFDENIGNMLPKLNGYVKEYRQQMEANQSYETLRQQVEEAASITVSSMPDLDLNSMIVYESPTMNTTELINLVLPILEDEEIKKSLTQVAEYVQEGKLDAMTVENLTRSMIGKIEVEQPEFELGSLDNMFESVMKKYKVEQILK
jgi:hypothetical protein